MTRMRRRGWEVLRNERGAEAEAGVVLSVAETGGRDNRGALCYCQSCEFYGSVPRSLMSGQPQLYPGPEPAVQQEPSNDDKPAKRTAPVWLQRLSLFVLVLFCVYLGVLVMLLPWWTRIWDRNEFILARPWLAAVLHNGAVRGMISGLGLLDIWIGISEAVHYRDYRG